MNEEIQLDTHDIEILRNIITEEAKDPSGIEKFELIQRLGKEGFDATVTSLKLLQLEKQKRLINKSPLSFNTHFYHLSDDGENWAVANISLFADFAAING